MISRSNRNDKWPLLFWGAQVWDVQESFQTLILLHWERAILFKLSQNLSNHPYLLLYLPNTYLTCIFILDSFNVLISLTCVSQNMLGGCLWMENMWLSHLGQTVKFSSKVPAECFSPVHVTVYTHTYRVYSKHCEHGYSLCKWN